jgi:hypothetical protein
MYLLLLAGELCVTTLIVIPAKAGIQETIYKNWIPPVSSTGQVLGHASLEYNPANAGRNDKIFSFI